MSCNPNKNKFNHLLEQYLDYSKCRLELCNREISCKECKQNMLRLHDNQTRDRERERIQEELKQCIQNGIIKIETGSERLFKIIDQIGGK